MNAGAPSPFDANRPPPSTENLGRVAAGLAKAFDDLKREEELKHALKVAGLDVLAKAASILLAGFPIPPEILSLGVAGVEQLVTAAVSAASRR